MGYTADQIEVFGFDPATRQCPNGDCLQVGLEYRGIEADGLTLHFWCRACGQGLRRVRVHPARIARRKAGRRP